MGGERVRGGEWRERDGRRGEYRQHRRNSPLGYNTSIDNNNVKQQTLLVSAGKNKIEKFEEVEYAEECVSINVRFRPKSPFEAHCFTFSSDWHSCRIVRHCPYSAGHFLLSCGTHLLLVIHPSQMHALRQHLSLEDSSAIRSSSFRPKEALGLYFVVNTDVQYA